MKAADALGLLAGLSTLGALRGGREGTGKRFTGLMDMLDGGGAGASGDRFEGGGLLSMLGNLFAKPIEAQDNVERIAADASATRALTDAIKPEPRPMQGSGNRMMDINDIPTSGPNPLAAAEIARMREAQRMMDINDIPAAPVEPSSVQPSMTSQDTSLLDVRPIRPREEALPAGLAMPVRVAPQLFPSPDQEFAPNIQQPEGMMMSKQQFEDFITPKYVAEYGRNPTQQQMDMAYNTYMSNTGLLQ